MIKKSTLLFVVIFMTISGFVYSQVENPYLNFNPEELKNTKNYTKNFNPGNYDEKVLYNCMTDMLNLLRSNYAFQLPLKHNIDFDSTAQMQAIHQAEKDEKTEFNVPPYKTLYFRLKKYGLTNNAIEFVTKAKASLGVQEYSYYDLCFELLKPLLKNIKTAQKLTDKQYSYMGFGYETDKYMKSMYASIILGNDRTFNNDKPANSEKDLPYTKKSGLSYYDEKICKKCNEDKALEVLSEYIQVKEDEVYMVCDDYKALKKLIGKEGDAVVLDFVQHSQYNCDGNVLDNDKVNHGFTTKPILYETILENNKSTEKKSTKLSSPLAPLPELLDKDSEYDINIIVLKESKYACRTIIKKKIECKNSDYNDKINFLKDESVKNLGDWLPVAEEGTHEIAIPFSLKKLDYSFADFDTLIQHIDAPHYKIKSIEIIAHNSLNYANDPTQMKNQKRRAESVGKALKNQYPDVGITISYDDSWEEFKKDVVNSSDYYDLTLFSKEEAIKKLKANNGQIAKALEEEYLVHHRFARVLFHVQYSIAGELENDFVTWKFSKAIESNNLPLAASIENYMIKKVESKQTNLQTVERLSVPVEKKYQALLNNILYMKYFLSSSNFDKICHQMNSCYMLDVTNPITIYNNMVCSVNAASFNSLTEIAAMQLEMDKLYTMPQLAKEKINNLNLSLQLKIIEYLNSVPKTTESNALYEATFEKIKTIRNNKMENWQNAYKFAAIFIKNYDYNFALSLMDPFISDATISEDFLFSYISIAAHREESYMSSLFSYAVSLAAEKNPTRLCGLFDKLPYCILDNAEVKKLICTTCNR